MYKNQHRAHTGIIGLDEILHGGLISERLYLLDGNPGAGKTTLALQFLLEGLKNGEKCLYITLSETKRELKAGAMSHGWDLSDLDVVELIADENELESESELTMLPPSEIELGATSRAIIEAVRRGNPTRMVIDSLSELRLLAQSSLRYRRQILAFKQFFIGRRCTLLLLDDRTSEGPDVQLHSIAHGVIALDSILPPYGQRRREVEVIKFRGSDFVSGRHDFAIRQGGITVFPRLVSTQHKFAFERESILSGVAALDTLLGGGVERGTSTLLIGPPGSGKSTIALQFAIAAAARADHAAAFLFDETKSAMLTRSRSIGTHLREGLGPGEIEIHQVDPAAISPGEFAYLVRSSVDRGARVVIIDSLNGYLNCVLQNSYLTAQLHELLSYLNSMGIATFLIVAQSGIMGPIMTSPVDASYLVDAVVMLRYYEHLGQVKKAISVLKKRTGGHESSIRDLRFDQYGIHLSEPLMSLRGILTGVPIESEKAAGTPDSAR